MDSECFVESCVFLFRICWSWTGCNLCITICCLVFFILLFQDNESRFFTNTSLFNMVNYCNFAECVYFCNELISRIRILKNGQLYNL